MATYTWIDYSIIVVFILSMLVGLKRGFIREAISLVTIIVAFIIAMRFSGSFANWLNGSAGAQAIVNALARFFGETSVSDTLSLITFGLSFFILFLLTMIIGEAVNKIVASVTIIPGLGLIDHILGIGFGAVRGFLLNVAILFLLNLTSVSESNAWVNSQLLSKFQPSILWLSNIVQPGWEMVKEKIGSALQNVGSHSNKP